MSIAVNAPVGDEPGRNAGRKAVELPATFREELDRLGTPDGRRFSGVVARHWGMWLAGLAVVLAFPGQLWIQVPAGLLMANQLHVLTILQHDCGHRAGYVTPQANLWVGRFLAWFIFMPFTVFTEMHRRHHASLGDVGRDPDAWFYAGGPVGVFFREWLFVPRFVFLSLTTGLPADARKRVIKELVFNVASYAGVIALLVWVGRADVIAFGFLGPLFFLALVVSPCFRAAEHYSLTRIALDDPRRYDIRFNTNTANHPLISALLINVNFHVEHHLYPRVPVYRLKEVHALFSEHRYQVSAWPFGEPRMPASAPAQDAARG